ncbi:MAG TPA: flagellar basal body-associated FliL family protein [Steroidobacter sp.]|jgi:flagellar FliL protein|nr:flagellar basal body-associated FliL family protein [Steroidobacteraceae bacterium]HLS82576.1 flagellar basal body-associated FliL family protein [Steroidobacter sp.]
MADGTPAGSGSKLLVIVLAAIVLAAAAGAGAYYLLSRGDADENRGADRREAAKGPALYVKFDPPFVVNFETKGLMRFLQVSIEAMTRDQTTADLLKVHDPMLRNELLLLLSTQSYEKISTREGKEQLRQEALEAVAKVLTSEGGDGAKLEQLYFTSFVMQ